MKPSDNDFDTELNTNKIDITLDAISLTEKKHNNK